MKLNKKDLLFWNQLSNFLSQFFDLIKLQDEDKFVFVTAFTHKSFSNENNNCPHNDYLEFIGDGVLQFIVTDWILDNHPQWGARISQ
ncbi:hypothetical protein [Mycoplasmopsis arginini]|nr:hypothetical protein [Mycoplasmopsis arginini]MDI3351213.1 Ribonuclease 3 [Mycoplasmopsis arginini]MDI3351766.1 Ribonuclease 3 [Mycoplasmopsis arginini]MDP4042772.1 hypothetical protein [Mycoplasmopsis arginini]